MTDRQSVGDTRGSMDRPLRFRMEVLLRFHFTLVVREPAVSQTEAEKSSLAPKKRQILVHFFNNIYVAVSLIRNLIFL